MSLPRVTLSLAYLLFPFLALAHDVPASALVSAQRSGDRLLLELHIANTPEPRLIALLESGSRAEKLAVMRGVAGARDPVELLAPLARHMASRDPLLAPAAATALWTVVTRLRPDALGEHAPEEVATALAPALALADDAHARPDLRAVAASLATFVQRLTGGSR